MSRILNEFEASKTALRRYLSRFFARSQDIEDMLQEVFVRAYAAEARGPDPAAPRLSVPRRQARRAQRNRPPEEFRNRFGRGFPRSGCRW